GRKECAEDLFRLLRGQSHTGIADRDQQLSIAGFRLDGKLASANRFLHSINAVDHEIHQHLLQLHTIRHDLGYICSQLCPDGYDVSRCLATEEDSHFSNYFVYVHQLPFRSTLLEKQADSLDDLCRARSILHDS